MADKIIIPSEKKLLMIRYNTENTGSLYWRVIIEGKEHLADHVMINVMPIFDTADLMPNGKFKHHFSCYYDSIEWVGTNLIVR